VELSVIVDREVVVVRELAPEQIARARAGDRAAQAAFVAMYQDRVHAVCMALAGPDAEDCAQEALIAALIGLRRFDDAGPARLGTYVLRIARNRCVDRSRSARVRVRTVDTEPLAGGLSADVSLEAARDAEAVRAAVLALPEDQRAVIALHTWGELEYDEIASILGVPIGTVRSRLARGRDALRARLAPPRTNQGAAG
jgi:RNA polymerase sigma-70 factor (ECF subfamily)